MRGDRITNQLMFVPPNYEEIKNEGRLKTILLYNGLGPWNVKQGEYFLLFDDGLLSIIKGFCDRYCSSPSFIHFFVESAGGQKFKLVS